MDLLQYDPIGNLVENRFDNERHTIPTQMLNHFNYVVPHNAPFFKKTADGNDVKVYHVEGDRYLIEGIDFNFTHKHLELSFINEVEIFGSITLINPELQGEIRIDEYQSVGDVFALKQGQVLQFYADRTVNPRTVSFEQVVGLPAAVPVLDHPVDMEDLKGQEDLIEAVDRVTAAILGREDKLELLSAALLEKVYGGEIDPTLDTFYKIQKHLKALLDADSAFLNAKVNETRIADTMQRSLGAFGNPLIPKPSKVESYFNQLEDSYPLAGWYDGDDAIIAVSSGGCLISPDDGTTWRLRENEYIIHDMDSSDIAVIAITSDDRVLKSTDKGSSWEVLFTSTAKVNGIRFFPEIDRFVLLTDVGIRMANNHANIWSDVQVSTNEYRFLASDLRVSPTGSPELWLTANNGVTFKSSDAGITWTSCFTGLNGDVVGIHATTDSIQVVFNDAKYVVSEDFGETWFVKEWLPIAQVKGMVGSADFKRGGIKPPVIEKMVLQANDTVIYFTQAKVDNLEVYVNGVRCFEGTDASEYTLRFDSDKNEYFIELNQDSNADRLIRLVNPSINWDLDFGALKQSMVYGTPYDHTGELDRSPYNGVYDVPKLGLMKASVAHVFTFEPLNGVNPTINDVYQKNNNWIIVGEDRGRPLVSLIKG